jgi:rhamnogalacturonyl hydrolase YesR
MRTPIVALLLILLGLQAAAQQQDQKGQRQQDRKASLLELLKKVNNHWQSSHTPEVRAFWDEAAYHTGNMELFAITGEENYRLYSERWASHNQWMGARSTDKSTWKYQYGEKDDYVLFGDWQICFQTYIDLYHLNPESYKIARAKEVMEYQMSTAAKDYWWWADGLYMVMPVMTKLYKTTGDKRYLEKLHEYFEYANRIMYDQKTRLYYRDAKYVYPKHKTLNHKKDFWARGNGWVFAGLAKVLKDLPADDPQYNLYVSKYQTLAKAILKSQQQEGYWTRSMLDKDHAPGPETSGTAFFTYGLFWGINNGYLKEKTYLNAALKGWKYLSEVALQKDSSVGYIQPIGEKAIPGQIVNANSTANFGVGAFLLAGAELYRYLDKKPVVSTIAENGWANNSVNVVVFRKNSLVTFKNTQYAAYYDADQYLVVAKRNINKKKWEVLRSAYKADAGDAHKSISIMVDDRGYLHVAWGQHNNQLNYVRNITAGSLILGAPEAMLGAKENKVSYPEFYKLANGTLLFMYRDGGSGNGNLMINSYNSGTKKWQRIQDNLIDGEGKRNAYWQTAIDDKGTIHLSWVWRESPDVSSNHDLCYASSKDGGLSWENAAGQAYQLPIHHKNAEYAAIIPQKTELINQTSMFADDAGNPYIAGYWKDKGSAVPQYHLVYYDGKSWRVNALDFRSTDFSLSGTGTKRIPISRPQVVAWKSKDLLNVALIFRDLERGNKISLALCRDLQQNNWDITDLSQSAVGDWEPSYDTELWRTKGRLDLFLQRVEQIDGEGKAASIPSPIQVLEWKPGQ